MTSCEHSTDAGAYALYALDESEASAFAEHLHTCAECRREVEHARAAADALPLAVAQVAPPPALRERIMRDVRSEAELLRASGPQADRVATRPRRAAWWHPAALRPVTAAAVACVLLAIGIGAGVTLRRDGAPTTRTISAQVTAPGARATLRVTGHRAALAVEHMPSPPPGEAYQVWLVKGHGRPKPTHTLFTVRNDGRATVQIDEPVVGVDQILVTAEPSGGSTAPTSSPVISARPA
ncbi:MAG: hypothetical protein JWO02_4740 [Solirubrobacterales bacterium]|nr:hypothetical protein [Solirubrobacterales bacterium]